MYRRFVYDKISSIYRETAFFLYKYGMFRYKKGNEGMKVQKHKSTWLIRCLSVMLTVLMLQGCGGSAQKSPEDLLADMKEFSISDGSASLYLDQSWTEEDTGVDTAFAVGKEDGSEAVILMQFPKNGLYQVRDLDSLNEYVESTYHPTNTEEIADFEVPGMSNVKAVTCGITFGGQTAQACIVNGETDYACYSMAYMAGKLSDSMVQSFKVSCSKFQENAQEIEDRTTVELSDTVRWFNASYAVLTELNGWDYNRFAGLPANDETMALEQQSLEQWWGVTDQASADETLDWILTEGHRVGFAENMKSLEEAGVGDISSEERKAFILDHFMVTEDEAQEYADNYAVYEQYGEHALDGWDYCRAMNLMSFYYLAGYYTEQEALDKSLEIAQTMQPLFESWDDLIESYMLGYEYWAEESSADRQAIYEDLKTREDNPYQVDYHTELEKTW